MPAASDLTILDRQKALLKLRRQQQQSSFSYLTSSFGDDDSILPISITHLHHQPTFQDASGYIHEENNETIHSHDVRHQTLGDLGNGWPDLAAGVYPPLIGNTRLREGESGNGSKKRKVGANATATESEDKEKIMKMGAEEARTAVLPKLEIRQSSSDDSDSSNRRRGSKVNSKATQKPDYIHVRARRGQATDSHSLAERVRREKISERMKYLQDLVPGCNKITGKAGMLDEIINYVQSLQRQVEFLSMKLATVNPSLDFSIDHFFSKEINSACSSSFPAVEMSSDGVDPSYIRFNPLQHATTCNVLDIAMNTQELELRSTTNSPFPDAFLDSFFNVITSEFQANNVYH